MAGSLLNYRNVFIKICEEGVHFYFKSPDLREKIIFNDPELKEPKVAEIIEGLTGVFPGPSPQASAVILVLFLLFPGWCAPSSALPEIDTSKIN